MIYVHHHEIKSSKNTSPKLSPSSSDPAATSSSSLYSSPMSCPHNKLQLEVSTSLAYCVKPVVSRKGPWFELIPLIRHLRTGKPFALRLIPLE